MTRGNNGSLMTRLWGVVVFVLMGSPVFGHPTDVPISAQVEVFLSNLSAQIREKTAFALDSKERYRFRWTPAAREGVRLDELTTEQNHQLRDILRTVLSEDGAIKVDAIIATEAALGVIEGAPSRRDPNKYHTTVFGTPGPSKWGLRFEGHHLSVNLSFEGEQLISATPLFLGANPETIPNGPDQGLRALRREVDLAWTLYSSLGPEQQKTARGGEEWFAGFLTTAGERRANLGKPAGIMASTLEDAQQATLRELIAAYVETVGSVFSTPYLKEAFAQEWPHLRFSWHGAEAPGNTYYYRIAGERLLIEHDGRSGGTHIHAIWRDAANDFGE